MLLKEAAAVQWVMDAFGHLKAIGYSAEAKPLLDKAGIQPDEGVADTGMAFIAAAAKRSRPRAKRPDAGIADTGGRTVTAARNVGPCV